MINVQGIRRNMKNVVKNYSEAQVKVREATSNDPWGPSSTLMSEIADLTYNVVAFSEIMQMIWKRLNDHGKNWRHVYKALVLLEYLIKTGSEKVAQQCRENIFAIQTLKDFQYIEENKDQGMNVREKSKLLVALLKDDEKLRNERTRALKAKERFAQSMSYMGSSSPVSESFPKTSSSYHESLSMSGDHYLGASSAIPSELENARPQTVGEEELQLQLALAMSKEEAEQEERVRKNDDLRLQLAINESERDKSNTPDRKSAVDDLLSLNLNSAANASVTDPWGVPLNNRPYKNGMASPHYNAAGSADPWAVAAVAAVQPSLSPPNVITSIAKSEHWSAAAQSKPLPMNDPWASSLNNKSTPTNDPWSSMSSSPNCDNQSNISSALSDLKPPTQSPSADAASSSVRKTPENFLGANSNLVNLDALVSAKTSQVLPLGGNPFATPSSSLNNPFQAAKPPPPTINQLRAQNQFTVPFDSSVNLIHTPPQLQQNSNAVQQQTHNPFAM